MSKTFTRPLDLYNHTVKRFAAMKKDFKVLHSQIVSESLRDSREATSGKLSKKETKGAFARSASGLKRGRLRRLPINIQTGALHDSFYLRRASGGVQAFHLYSKAAHARFVLALPGTRKMVARGFREQIRKQWRARNKALLDTFRKRIRS